MEKIITNLKIGRKYGFLGEETKFKNLKVGDVITVDGYDSIVVYDIGYERYSVLGFLAHDISNLGEKMNCDYKVKYPYKKINNENITEISGFNLEIRELIDGKIPVYKNDIESIFGKDIEIII